MLNESQSFTVKMFKGNVTLHNLSGQEENSASNANNPLPADFNSYIPNTTDGQLLRYYNTSHQNPGFLEQIIFAHEDYSPQCITNWCPTTANRVRLPLHSYEPIVTQPFSNLSAQPAHMDLIRINNAFLYNPQLYSQYAQQTGTASISPQYISPKKANCQNGKPQGNLKSNAAMRSEKERIMDFTDKNEVSSKYLCFFL